MPAYWLLKSEPEVWSWEDQEKKGVESWDGVRNPQAQKNMRAMKVGDSCFFYHSGKEKSVVGIVSVTREIYPDPSDESGKSGMVDVKAVRPFRQPVTLSMIKGDPTFADLIMVRQTRLSVVPLEKKHWERMVELENEEREEVAKERKPRKRAKKDSAEENGAVSLLEVVSEETVRMHEVSKVEFRGGAVSRAKRKVGRPVEGAKGKRSEAGAAADLAEDKKKPAVKKVLNGGSAKTLKVVEKEALEIKAQNLDETFLRRSSRRKAGTS